MSNDLILKRLQEIYEQKIKTKNELTEDEKSFIIDNFDKVRENGLLDDEMYSRYSLGILTSPSFDFESSEVADLISELNDLPMWQQPYDKYTTKYEQLLYATLTESVLNINDEDSARLISESKNSRLVRRFMQSKDISDVCKLALLRSVEEQKWASREEYFDMIYQLSQNKKTDISISLQMKILNSYKYKADEVENAHDNSYDKLLYFSAHNMDGLDEFERKGLIYSLTNIEYIKRIVESDYKKFNLSDEERNFLIIRSNSEEYIDQILKGKVAINLGEDGLIKLVIQNGPVENDDKEYFLRYANGEEYAFDTSDRIFLIILSADKEAAKKFLESNELSIMEQVKLLSSIDDRAYSEQYIERLADSIKMYLKDEYISKMGTDTEKQEWNSRITTILDITDLNFEDATKLPDDAMIRIPFDKERNIIYLRFIYKRKISSNT